MPTVEHASIVELLLVTVVVGGIAYAISWLLNRTKTETARRTLANLTTEFESLKSVSASRDERLSKVEDDLRAALHENGSLQSNASRVEELRETVRTKEENITNLNSQLSAANIEKAEARKDAEAASEHARQAIAQERAALKEIVAVKEEQIEKLNDFISQARSALSDQFKALSADTFKDASEQLVKVTNTLIEKHAEKTTSDVKLHHTEIEKMLKPVEETIKRLDQHVENTNSARVAAETLLNDQVKRLAGASESLTNALRKPVIRGSWGEMTLENALENAGLESEIDYILQHSTDSEDGRKRTDAIINLPKGRKLVIDSKNLMESYIALANEEDDAQKSILADSHSRSLRNHVKALSSKEYWKLYEGLDCVLLFIPHDGMYHAAIQDEAELIRDACEKRVFITNTMSLIPLLKAIRYVLNQDRLNHSAEEISKVGAELYGEMTRFAENIGTIGDRLRSTVKAYNDVIPGLDRYILSKSRKLKQLGAAKGNDAELPDLVESETKLFSSRELKGLNAVDDSADVLPA